MDPREMDCIRRLQAITEIQSRWDHGHNLEVNDPLRPAVIGTARDDFNKAAKHFKDKRRLVVSSRRDVRAVIFLREEYGWYGTVKIFATQTEIDRIATFAHENGIQLTV